MSDTEMIIGLRVGGRVQGVGFRAFVQREATRRGLRGWVRNRHDGTVEAVFSGAPAAVDALLDLCRRGPPEAHVVSAEKFHVDPSCVAEMAGVSGFQQLPTI